MKKKITVIIPAYNAEKKVSTIIGKLIVNRDNFNQVIIVNDGSTDNSRQKLIKELSRLNKNKLFISHKKNYGYGGAQKTLFKYFLKGEGDIAVLLHADDQYPFNKIKEITKPILEKRADIVLGSRFNRSFKRYEMPVHKYIGNRILTFMENFILKANLTEYHTGFRAYSREVLERLNYNKYSNYFDFDSEILFECIRKNYIIDEIPIKSKYADEISYLHPLKYGINILKLIIRESIEKKELNKVY